MSADIVYWLSPNQVLHASINGHCITCGRSHPTQIPEGEYDPSACEVCGSLRRNSDGELLHDQEDCFK